MFKSGDVKVVFFGNENNKEKLFFECEIIKVKEINWIKKGMNDFFFIIIVFIYLKEMIWKSFFYKFFFGNYYWKYYSLFIEVKIVILDILMGGLKLICEGGGY